LARRLARGRTLADEISKDIGGGEANADDQNQQD
jgi:hypothetical protein